MLRSLLKAFSVGCVAFSALASAQESTLPPVRSEPAMKAELDAVYVNWRNAMIRRDIKAWEDATALYRQIETKNRIISEKHPFPEALFSDLISPPSLAKLRPLAVLTRRDTASMIYFGKADFGISDPNEVTDTFLVLRYLKEEGKWRFDNSRIVRIGKDTDVLHLMARRDMSFLSADEFQPLGFVPPIPRSVKTPELLGEAWVSSIGFETEIWINGHRLGTIKNGSGKEIVMGGVRKQTNDLSLRVKKIPSGEHNPRFEIAIYAAKGPGVPATRVFHYGPKETMPTDLQIGFTGRIRK